VLAGLISDEDRQTASRVPGLGDMPVVGKLFSQTNNTRTKTEIVLLITPHIIRTLDRPDARTTEFSAGTETSIEGPALIGGAPAPIIIDQQPAPQRPAPAPPPAPGPNTMVPFGGVQEPSAPRYPERRP
jgi:general secretion pathway protein D